jgi:hypothetical protein
MQIIAAKFISPRDLLVALKKKFCPSETTRENEIIRCFTALQRAPAKSQDLEDWISEWQAVIENSVTTGVI